MQLTVIRVLDDDGRVIHPEREPAISGPELRHMLETMLLVRFCDERLLKLQRQGRIGFYLTATGEEATHVGPAWALRLAASRRGHDGGCGGMGGDGRVAGG